jgi:nucleoside-diphosphate-sugar epimerase
MPDVDWITGDLVDPDIAHRLPPLAVVYSVSPIGLLPKALPAMIQGGASRVIAFSSTSRFTKLDSPVEAERQAAQAWIEGEARVISLCEAASVSWTILRPTMIYAEGQDKNVSRLACLIRRYGVLPLSGGGSGLRQPVHGDDLAAAAIAAAASAAAANQAYNLPGGETMSYREMVGRIFDALHRPRRIITVPPWAWRLLFALARPLLPPGVNAAMGARMSNDMTFDAEAARRDIGWNPRAFHPRFEGSRSGGGNGLASDGGGVQMGI